jgi:hypothetical protein
MCKTILLSCVLLLTIIDTNSSPPAKDVFEALRSVCVGKFQGGICPYAIAYDIATQLAGTWHNRDGATGLWSDGSATMWWPSGVGLWTFAEFFHTMGGRSISIIIEVQSNKKEFVSGTDKLYFAARWAAIETAKHQNNYVHTKFTDDQAWWANGALRLEQYIRSIGDGTVELLNAAQAVINDNVAHETGECGGG